MNVLRFAMEVVQVTPEWKDPVSLIPTDALDLFGPPNHAVLSTLQADGSPQASVVWITHDRGIPSFNTARGRVKVRNLQRDPRCTFVVFDLADPERYVEVRGTARIAPDDGLDHCQTLSYAYDGAPFRELEDGEVRVVVTIDPEHVFYHAGD